MKVSGCYSVMGVILCSRHIISSMVVPNPFYFIGWSGIDLVFLSIISLPCLPCVNVYLQKLRLVKLSSGIDVSCVLCSGSLETVEHMFFFCYPYSSEVLRVVCSHFGCRDFPVRWQDWHIWVIHFKRSTAVRVMIFYAAISGTIYFIWRERNSRCFASAGVPACELPLIWCLYLRTDCVACRFKEGLPKMMNSFELCV